MRRQKQTSGQRIRKNLRKTVTRPFRKRRKAPEAHREPDLVDLEEFTGLERETNGAARSRARSPACAVSTSEVHLPPRVDMEEAIASAGMREIDDGLWERVEGVEGGAPAR